MISLLVLLFGIVLLVGGLLLMRHGLSQVLSYRLHQILSATTITPWRGLLVGMIAATLFQSSTAVCLITIGLVTAECLTFRQALGLILGANIGTCSTVQLISLFSPEQLLPLLICFAIVGSLFKKTHSIGLALAGLATMFCGLYFLNSGVSAMQQVDDISRLLRLADKNPWSGILGGVLITFLFQSSSAATAMLMALTESGMTSLTTAAYIVYGSNLGSCLSSLIISTVAPPAAKQVAVAHIMLNVFGVLLFYPMTGHLIVLTRYISSDIALQVATIHTLFNVFSSLAVLPVIGPFSRLVQVLTPSKRI